MGDTAGKKAVTIGRRESKALRKEIEQRIVNPSSKKIKLHSGVEVEFRLRSISAEDVESKTFVDGKVNGRDQALLSRQNVSDISVSMSDNQFYTIFAYTTEDGLIGIIDGSRRRFAAIENGLGLELYVCSDSISRSDLIFLARDMQTAKPHTMREDGAIFNQLVLDGVKVAEISSTFKKSESYVSRCLDVFKLDKSLLMFFQDPSSIGARVMVALVKVNKGLVAKGISLSAFCESVALELSHSPNGDNGKTLTDGSITDAEVLTIIESTLKKIGSGESKKNEGFTHTPIRVFKNKNRRAKISAKGDLRRFELKGFTDDIYAEIESQINNLLKKYE
jgi:ParB family chromosome partitioning protein